MAEFKKTAKQIEATRLMANNIQLLLEGGSRAGKTFIIIRNLILRAIKYPNTKHLTGRLHFNHAKNSLWYGTIPEVLRICFPEVRVKENKTDWFISFTNGSEIWLAGFDDKERIEKILGNEYATIHLNEASQLSYDLYEIVKTRLNPPKGVEPKLWIDYNPPNKTHWGFQLFHDFIDPVSKNAVNPDDFPSIVMNPLDNKENLNDTYISILEGLGERNKRRFFYGLYSDDSDKALWKRNWISSHRVEYINDLQRVVIAVDPAVSGNETSDDTGIIVAGAKKVDGEEQFYILADYTYHGDVTGWGQSVVDAYHRHKADKVVAEKNQGGDLVTVNLRNYDKYIPVTLVHASRGKAVRAEPVADLYSRGLVHHVGNLIELEDELCSWTPEDKVSPNRLDALVWGLSHLTGATKKSGGVDLTPNQVKNFWS